MDEKFSDLLNFFIFNTNLGKKEGDEEQKIMLFIGSSAKMNSSTQTSKSNFFATLSTGATNGVTKRDIDCQVKHIGLAEAFINFTTTFSSEECRCVHTQKSRQVFFNPEPNYWMVLTVSVPYVTNVQNPAEPIYLEDAVQDSVLDGVVKQSYLYFAFFYQSFGFIETTSGYEYLKTKLHQFYTKYWSSLDFSRLSLSNIYQGINFLPLNKNPFLRVHSFISCVEATYPQIENSVFCYSDKLVWCSLEQKYMRIIYRYITDFLLPGCFEEACASTAISSSNSNHSAITKSHKTLGNLHLNVSLSSTASIRRHPVAISTMSSGFLIGPSDLSNTGSKDFIPEFVYILKGDVLHSYYLLVYHAYKITLTMLINSKQPPQFSFYEQLDRCLSKELENLSQQLNENSFNKPTSADLQYKYLYYNNMNLAVKSNVYSSFYPYDFHINSDLMRLMTDMHDDFEGSKNDGEIFVRTRDDVWVVGRRSDEREFFVILSNKNATLMSVSEEVSKLTAEQFTTVFFVD